MWSIIGFVLSLIIAVWIPSLLNNILNAEVDAQVVMLPDNVNLQAWESNIPGATPASAARRRLADSSSDPTQVFYELNFFNVTNEAEMMAGGKPNVTAVGPYVYNEYFQKFDISWSPDQEELTYNTMKFYTWAGDAANPGLSPDDRLLLINPVVVGMQYLLGQVTANMTALLEVAIEQGMQEINAQVEAGLAKARKAIDDRKLLPAAEKAHLEGEIDEINRQLEVMYNQLYAFITVSNPIDLVLKIILGKSPNGLSPFTYLKPGPAYFGWLNDPILTELQTLLNVVQQKTNMSIPFSTAVPGSVSNDTSIEDVRRRRASTTVRTGKSNTKMVGNLLVFQGMESIYGCSNPMASQNTSAGSGYVEGVNFPACELFDLAWNESTIRSKGYTAAWEDAQANLVYGRYCAGELFPRPLDPDYTGVFVGDIYRGALLERTSTEDWYGVQLSRLQIQQIDMDNSTVYPANAAYFSNGPMGLINLTSAMGAPSFGSYPHFLECDTRLLDQVNGLDPVYERDSTYLDVEPFTGLLARARKQMQTNFFLKAQEFPNTDINLKYEAHDLCGNLTALLVELRQDPLPCGSAQTDALFDLLYQEAGWQLHNGGLDGGLFMPYAYSNENMQLSETDANQIVNSIYAVQSAEVYAYRGGLALAAFFLVLTLYLTWGRVMRGEKVSEIFCGSWCGRTGTRRQQLANEKASTAVASGRSGDIHSPLLGLDGGI